MSAKSTHRVNAKANLNGTVNVQCAVSQEHSKLQFTDGVARTASQGLLNRKQFSTHMHKHNWGRCCLKTLQSENTFQVSWKTDKGG